MSHTETMIPELPPNTEDIDALDFYDKLLGNYEEQSSVHEKWHTHTNNPSVCWICDILMLSRKVLYLTEKYLSKSSLDNETSVSHVDVPELEIEEEMNDEGIVNVPEYDTVDDDEEVDSQ